MALLLSHTNPSPVQQPQDWETLRFPVWRKPVGFEFFSPRTTSAAPLLPGPSQEFGVRMPRWQRQASDWGNLAPFVPPPAIPSFVPDPPFDIRPWAKQRLPNDWISAPFAQAYMPAPDAPFFQKYPKWQSLEVNWYQINQYGTLAPLSVPFFDQRFPRWQKQEAAWTQIPIAPLPPTAQMTILDAPFYISRRTYQNLNDWIQVCDPNAVRAPLIPGPAAPFEIRPWAKQRLSTDWTTAPFEQAYMPAPDAPFSVLYPRWQKQEASWTQVRDPSAVLAPLIPGPTAPFDIRYPQRQSQEIAWTQLEQTVTLAPVPINWFDWRFPRWQRLESTWTQLQTPPVPIAPATQLDDQFIIAPRIFNNLNDWTQVNSGITFVSTATQLDDPFIVAPRTFNNLNDWTQVNDPNPVNAPLIPGPAASFDIRYPRRQWLEVAWTQVEQSATLQPPPISWMEQRYPRWQWQEAAWTQVESPSTLGPVGIPWFDIRYPQRQRQESTWTQVEQSTTLAFLSVPWFDLRYPQWQRQEAAWTQVDDPNRVNAPLIPGPSAPFDIRYPRRQALETAWTQVDSPLSIAANTFEVDPPFYIRLRVFQNLNDWTQVNDPRPVRAPLIPGPTAPFDVRMPKWQRQENTWIQVEQSATLAPVPIPWFDFKLRLIAKSINWDAPSTPIRVVRLPDPPLWVKTRISTLVEWTQVGRFVPLPIAPQTEIDPPWVVLIHRYAFVTWTQVESPATFIPPPPIPEVPEPLKFRRDWWDRDEWGRFIPGSGYHGG